MALARIDLHQVDAGLGAVVDMEEFPARCSGAPDDNFLVAAQLGFVRLADQRRNNVTCVEVEIVPRTVKVCWHCQDEITPILLAIGLAELDARYFGNGVPFIGGFEWGGQQRLFRNRLGRQLRIDAARTQEQELRYPGAIGRLNDVRLELL